ncbi:MAG: type ISP restriction/modification enzyme [Bryobacteraceae bacterium]
MEVATGFETARDRFAIAFTEKELRDRLDVLAGNQTDQAIRDEFGLDDKRDWDLPSARKRIKQLKDRYAAIRQIAYRPFDDRFTHYDDIIVTWPRKKNLDHIGRLNPALIASRMIKGEIPNHFFVVEHPPEKIFISGKTSNNAFVFPLFRSSQGKQKVLEGPIASVSNLSPEFAALVAQRLKRDVLDAVSLQQVFGYIYAIVHSKTYRERYAEELKVDFPRIPITSEGQLFDALSVLGSQLVNLHLAASQGDTNRYWSTWNGSTLSIPSSKPAWFGNNFIVEPGYPKWLDGSIWINGTTGLSDVPSGGMNETESVRLFEHPYRDIPAAECLCWLFDVRRLPPSLPVCPSALSGCQMPKTYCILDIDRRIVGTAGLLQQSVCARRNTPRPPPMAQNRPKMVQRMLGTPLSCPSCRPPVPKPVILN